MFFFGLFFSVSIAGPPPITRSNLNKIAPERQGKQHRHMEGGPGATVATVATKIDAAKCKPPDAT
jgi:hypothetical protein